MSGSYFNLPFGEVVGKVPIGRLLKEILPYVRDCNFNINNDNSQLLEVFPNLVATIPDCLEAMAAGLKLQNDKESTYGSSWCKRGELEVFFNVSRKFDRLEKMLLTGSKDSVGEPMVETVADLAIYCFLWVTYIKTHRPEEYDQWLAKIHNKG